MNLSKFLMFFTLIFFTQKVVCQKEIYLSNPPFFQEMEVHQNFLYFGENDILNDSTQLCRYDLTNENPEKTTIFTLEGQITDLTAISHFLYFTVISKNNANHLKATIQVIDLLNLDNPPEIVLEPDYIPINIKAYENSLFLSKSDISELDSCKVVGTEVQKLLKLQLNNLEEEPIVIADSLAIVDLDIHDGSLIFYERNKRSIFKYESEIEFLVSVIGAINEIAVRDNELYLADNSFDPFIGVKGGILKLDLNNLEDEPILFSDDVTSPISVEVYNNNLYVYGLELDTCPGEICRFNLDDETTSTIQIHEENNLIVYPNPSADFLYLQNKEPCTYNIFSLDGKHILSGELGLDKKINITDIPTGLFYISFKDGSTAKFQKINRN